jgi:hypothetical protein
MVTRSDEFMALSSLDLEVWQHVFEFAEGLGLLPGFLEPSDIIRIFPPLLYLLIDLDGENDRNGFSLADDYFRFRHFRFHGRMLRDW